MATIDELLEHLDGRKNDSLALMGRAQQQAMRAHLAITIAKLAEARAWLTFEASPTEKSVHVAGDVIADAEHRLELARTWLDEQGPNATIGV